MKPAVIEPSHIPRMSRHTKSPAKFLHAACEQSAIAHIKMLQLSHRCEFLVHMLSVPQFSPHPFPHREPLKREVLGKLEEQITEVKHCPEPVVSTSPLGIASRNSTPDLLVGTQMC